MLKIERVYHMGIPVNDIDRAKAFYTDVLGFEYIDRIGGGKFDRLRAGDDVVVLFERPQPHQCDAVAQDGVAHQAFEMDMALYDEALETIKSTGRFEKVENRESGNTIYLFDPEGNHLELHFSRQGAAAH